MNAALEHALQDWYPVAMVGELAPGELKHSKLLGVDITVLANHVDSATESTPTITVRADGAPVDVQQAFDHWWVCLGNKPRSLFTIEEASEADRRFVPCGVVRVACSPLRAVENFLDIAHFPFVHTGVLGAEPHTEVYKYDVKVDESVDEVIATNIKFYQPQAAKSAEGGIQTEYIYRVPAPMAAVLYKTCPLKPDALDVIALFVQPLDEQTCDVWPWMALYDDTSTQAELIQFQQLIFLQDRSILENQLPKKLPLDPGQEIPTKADYTSVAYRRWLKKRGAYYGALEVHP